MRFDEESGPTNPEPEVDTPPPEGATEELYPGDHGELPLDARRVFVRLIHGPFIDVEKHGQIWNALLQYEAQLRARLGDLFLELILDRDLGVAFVRQADTQDLDVPKILRRTKLVFIDSALLLHLRGQLNEAEAYGKRATISFDEMVGHLMIFEQEENRDRAGFLKRAHAAIDKAKKNNFITKIRGSDGRYEISPVLKLLFGPDEVAHLHSLYSKLIAQAQPNEEEGNG
jgi:hypothetical protein